MNSLPYFIYLRKSRADIEAEMRSGDEENKIDTLERHRKTLVALAEKLQLPVGEIYEEVVSGDTIADRPVIQQVLREVEQGLWAGGIVMEVERLARGDTIDQGIIAQTFKYSDTKIVTPMKTYDPMNEFDEEYFEFGLFMSRREYKTINRRLQNGRYASAKEGNFVGSIAPFGYEKYKLTGEKGHSLRIIPEKAEIVKLIFDLYTKGLPDDFGNLRRLGTPSIAKYLNEKGYKSHRHDYWLAGTVKDIITNPAYCGKIRWGYQKQVKRMVGGKIVKTRPINDENCMIVDGKHEAIVSTETWELANDFMKNNPPSTIGLQIEIKNPLAGLIFCKCCGRKMSYRAGRPGKLDYLVCKSRECKNVGTPIWIVEERAVAVLTDWLKRYKIKPKGQTSSLKNMLGSIDDSIKVYEKEKEKYKLMLNKAFEAFEQGTYDDEQFSGRTNEIRKKTKEITDEIAKFENSRMNLMTRIETTKATSANPKAIMDIYKELGSAQEKNDLLKQVVEKFVYYKEKSGMYRDVSVDDFEMDFYPKLVQ